MDRRTLVVHCNVAARPLLLCPSVPVRRRRAAPIASVLMSPPHCCRWLPLAGSAANIEEHGRAAHRPPALQIYRQQVDRGATRITAMKSRSKTVAKTARDIKPGKKGTSNPRRRACALVTRPDPDARDGTGAKVTPTPARRAYLEHHESTLSDDERRQLEALRDA